MERNSRKRHNSVVPTRNFFLVLFRFAVGPSHSPPMCQSSHSLSGAGYAPGIFSFSPANMISAVKQKSAFAPVVRPGASPTMALGHNMAGLQGGWAHTILSVSIQCLYTSVIHRRHSVNSNSILYHLFRDVYVFRNSRHDI